MCKINRKYSKCIELKANPIIGTFTVYSQGSEYVSRHELMITLSILSRYAVWTVPCFSASTTMPIWQQHENVMSMIITFPQCFDRNALIGPVPVITCML